MVVEKGIYPEVGTKKPPKGAGETLKDFWEEPKTRRGFLKLAVVTAGSLLGWSFLRRAKEKRPLSALVSGKSHLPSQEKPPQETPPPVTEETTPEEIKEFTPDMIKNRLYRGGELPMWYIEDRGDDEHFVSAVIASLPKFNQGELKEIVVPVAFQNPTTGTFFLENLTLGPAEFGFGIVDLTDWRFPDRYGWEGYVFYTIDSQNLAKRLHVGEQIAFTLFTSGGKTPSNCEQIPHCLTATELINRYLQNDISIIKAMRSNEDLPSEPITLLPLIFFVNRE